MVSAGRRSRVPDIGDFDDVPVIEILVSDGDTVSAEDPLVTLESDKATMDVPAPFAGTVKKITVKRRRPRHAGHRAARDRALRGRPDSNQGSEAADEGAGSEAEAPDAIAAATQAEQPDARSAAAQAPSPRQRLSRPSAHRRRPTAAVPPTRARRYAAWPASSASTCAGCRAADARGASRKEDVRAAVRWRGPGGSPAARRPARARRLHGLPAWPTVDFSKFGPVETRRRCSRIQRISGPNLARNWVMIPHVTHNDEADITELEAWRKRSTSEHEREGVKFTMVAFLIKAASVAALKASRTSTPRSTVRN